MTDTPEMIEWLNRIILGTKTTPGHGKKNIYRALNNLGEARVLLHKNLGYDITRKQFEGLREAREAESPEYQVRQSVIRYQNKKTRGRVRYQTVYRDNLGRFAKNPNK